MKRLKKDLEKILATRVHMTLHGQTVIDVPLEPLYHVERFLRGPIPIDLDLTAILQQNKIIK